MSYYHGLLLDVNNVKEVNKMVQMRTIDQLFRYILEIDPQSNLTRSAIRRLVVQNKIKSSRIGNKYLVSISNFEEYFNGSNFAEEENVSGIRKVKQ